MTDDGPSTIRGRAVGPHGTAMEPAWLVRLREPGRRLFVAVPLPSDAIKGIAALVEGVRATDGAAIVGPVGRSGRGSTDVRWVRLDALHVTVRFIGPTLDPDVAVVERAVAAVAAAAHPFDVRVAGAGAFPGPDRPRALWLGIGAGHTELGRLAEALDRELVALGRPADDRAFRPHLTLARSDGVRAGPRLARRLIDAADGFFVRWRATSLVLFESRTGGGPARYVRLLEAPLGDVVPPSQTGPEGTVAGGTIGRDTAEPIPPVPVQGDPGST